MCDFEKMMGMKDILTPDEEKILKVLEESFEEIDEAKELGEFLAYLMAFTTAMKLVKYQMEVLPGEELICRLDSLLDKVEESLSTKSQILCI